MICAQELEFGMVTAPLENSLTRLEDDLNYDALDVFVLVNRHKLSQLSFLFMVILAHCGQAVFVLTWFWVPCWLLVQRGLINLTSQWTSVPPAGRTDQLETMYNQLAS